MKPRSRSQPEESGAVVPDERLERIATPLTVLHANIQLLQRRIRNGNMPDPQGLLRVLDKLEQASRTISGELRELHDAISPEGTSHAMMQGDRSSVVHDEEKRDT